MKKRTLHIDNEEWTYSIGKSNIPVWSPSGEKSLIKLRQLPGYKEWAIKDENTLGFSLPYQITPQAIKTHIERVILK